MGETFGALCSGWALPLAVCRSCCCSLLSFLYVLGIGNRFLFFWSPVGTSRSTTQTLTDCQVWQAITIHPSGTCIEEATKGNHPPPVVLAPTESLKVGRFSSTERVFRVSTAAPLPSLPCSCDARFVRRRSKERPGTATAPRLGSPRNLYTSPRAMAGASSRPPRPRRTTRPPRCCPPSFPTKMVPLLAPSQGKLGAE